MTIFARIRNFAFLVMLIAGAASVQGRGEYEFPPCPSQVCEYCPGPTWGPDFCWTYYSSDPRSACAEFDCGASVSQWCKKQAGGGTGLAVMCYCDSCALPQ
jgi:hypothetical protein